MAQQTFNRLVEDLGAGLKRETTTGAPAVETEGARLAILPALRKANVAIPSAAVVLTVGGVDADAGSAIIAPADGQVVGVGWSWSAAPTHVLGTVQATVGGTAGGSVVTVDAAQTGYVALATPLAFSQGNALGAKVTTDANFLPANDDLTVFLAVRWNP